MDPTKVTGADGKEIRLTYTDRPETWTERQIQIEILRLLRDIKDNQNKVTLSQDFVLPKADPTQRKG